jgi:two-component system sensor histidine kinase PilS (NtrC family)
MPTAEAATPVVESGAPQDGIFPPPQRSHWVSLRFLGLARVAMVAVLIMFVGLSEGDTALLDDRSRARFLPLAVVYFGLAVGFLVAARRLRPWFYPQLGAQVAVDLAVLIALMQIAGGVRSGLGVLVVSAVAGASVLCTPRLAALFGAIAALAMMASEVARGMAGEGLDGASLGQIGLTGVACLALGTGIGWLATRLNAQERLARRRGEDLQAQFAITSLVVAELRQGVIVLDGAGRARTMNPAAGRLLAGDGDGSRLAWLVARVSDTAPGVEIDIDMAGPPDAGEVAAAGGGPLRLRVRRLMPEAIAPDAAAAAVLVLEDLREVEDRAQQLKLASMGRLSASIAHEIRNPLAAIRHANGLLAERLSAPLEMRLSRIVEDNSVRIDRIVEDVLAIARRERREPERLNAAEFLPSVVGELEATGQLMVGRVTVQVDATDPIVFDAHPLRQVLLNLLGNAMRYASSAAGAIQLAWRRGADDRLELIVADDGPGPAPALREHMFEPFFTSEARGSGLGLFLARELCDASGASLRHEMREREAPRRSVFVIRPAR